MAKKTLNMLSGLLLAVVVVLALLVVGVRAVGITPYVVLSDSMAPVFSTGSLVYTRSVDPADVKVGDVITFDTADGTTVSHRVTQVAGGSSSEPRFRTKGDANNVEDAGVVISSQLRGEVVFSLPYLGSIMSFIQTSRGRVVAIVVGVAIVALIALPGILFRDEGRAKGSQGASRGNTPAHSGGEG